MFSDSKSLPAAPATPLLCTGPPAAPPATALGSSFLRTEGLMSYTSAPIPGNWPYPGALGGPLWVTVCGIL